MEFSTKAGRPDKLKADCVVVGVYESRTLGSAAKLLDEAAKKQLTAILRNGDMEGKLGATLMLYNIANVAAERVLLVGLGRGRDLRDKQYRDIVRSVTKTLLDSGAREAAWYFDDVHVEGRDAIWKAEQAVLVADEMTYRFDGYKSKPDASPRPLKHLLLVAVDKIAGGKLEPALGRAQAVAAGIALAKDLGNTPPNVCTPAYLAQRARDLAKAHRMKIQVLEQADMEKLGMGSLLAVARGSRNPPKLICLQYQGGDAKKRPVALVGKGITFDTGGISIKPAAEMDEMKYDMCGAASVLGTLRAVAQMKLPLNVVGVIPTCENMPDGNASRPGDIVTSLSGQTVEILNTDAEGRLILCDALTYSERFEPVAVVDIATLTGACVIALGHVASGLFGNDEALVRRLLAAGDYAHDRAWQLPIWDDYQEQLKSNFADVANIGGRPAGSITAACFLSRFSKKFPWAHLDIAGTAWKSGREKGATGRPVGLLTQYLVDLAGNK